MLPGLVLALAVMLTICYLIVNYCFVPLPLPDTDVFL